MGLLFGKLLPYLVIGFAELCLILTFMRFVFQVPIHGNVLILAFLSLPYLFVSLSIGILVSSKANTQSEAIQLAFLTFLPSIFFSGYIFPRETMPTIFYVISYFIPRATTSTSPVASSCAAPAFPISGSMASLSMLSAPSFFSLPPAASRKKSSWLKHFAGLSCVLVFVRRIQVFS